MFAIFMAHSLSPRQPWGMVYFIAVIVAAYLGSSTAARTEPEPDRVCFSTAEAREKIHAHGLLAPFRVMRSAASRSQAEAIGAKLCRWSEEFVYEISLLRRDGRVIHVFVNAKTGLVIGSKNEH
jgi:uncharacterized membrane protein YkoI